MPGFLDQSAPSAEAEYSRYVDGDVLGKLITKNFLLNRAGYSAEQVIIPVGRYGDAKDKYSTKWKKSNDLGDGYIIDANSPTDRLTFEIKCARVNIANRYLGQPKEKQKENWAFTNILTSPAKEKKSYDILIAIGIGTLGLEDEGYWKHFEELVQKKYQSEGRHVSLGAKPHQSEFLSLCSFFIIPFSEIPTNGFRLNIQSIPKSKKYSCFHARGDDSAGCKRVWDYAISQAHQTSSGQQAHRGCH